MCYKDCTSPVTEAVASGCFPVAHGTKEFITRNGEFTVNVASVEHNKPTLGVVLCQQLNCLFVGYDTFEEKNEKRQLNMACIPSSERLRVGASRSHGDYAALNNFLRGCK